MEAPPSAGGLEGPESTFIMFKSQDGHDFIVKRQYTQASSTIKGMLSGPGRFAENELNKVHFKEIPSHVLIKVFNYFIYKERYTNSTSEIPEYPIPPEVALELLMVSYHKFILLVEMRLYGTPWSIPLLIVILAGAGGLGFILYILCRRYRKVAEIKRMNKEEQKAYLASKAREKAKRNSSSRAYPKSPQLSSQRKEMVKKSSKSSNKKHGPRCYTDNPSTSSEPKSVSLPQKSVSSKTHNLEKLPSFSNVCRNSRPFSGTDSVFIYDNSIQINSDQVPSAKPASVSTDVSVV